MDEFEQQHILAVFAAYGFSTADEGPLSPLPDWMGKTCKDCPFYVEGVSRCAVTMDTRDPDATTCVFFDDREAGKQAVRERMHQSRIERMQEGAS